MTSPVSSKVVKKMIANFAYNDEDVIGKGQFGYVYQGIDLETSEMVAIKIIPVQTLANKLFESLLINEVSAIKMLHSPYIVRFIDLKFTANNIYLITEFCDSGDLATLLKKKGSFSETEVIDYLWQISEGFKAMQACKLLHRDLKPANILLHDGRVKIADLGFSKRVEDFNNSLSESTVGSPIYMSPQILFQQGYTSKCDVWSLGIVLYQLIYGKVPWQALDVPTLAQKVQQEPIVFPARLKLSADLKDLIIGCLKYDEKDRFSWDDVFNHPATLSSPMAKGFPPTVVKPVAIEYVDNWDKFSPPMISGERELDQTYETDYIDERVYTRSFPSSENATPQNQDALGHDGNHSGEGRNPPRKKNRDIMIIDEGAELFNSDAEKSAGNIQQPIKTDNPSAKFFKLPYDYNPSPKTVASPDSLLKELTHKLHLETSPHNLSQSPTAFLRASSPNEKQTPPRPVGNQEFRPIHKAISWNANINKDYQHNRSSVPYMHKYLEKNNNNSQSKIVPVPYATEKLSQIVEPSRSRSIQVQGFIGLPHKSDFQTPVQPSGQANQSTNPQDRLLTRNLKLSQGVYPTKNSILLSSKQNNLSASDLYTQTIGPMGGSFTYNPTYHEYFNRNNSITVPRMKIQLAPSDTSIQQNREHSLKRSQQFEVPNFQSSSKMEIRKSTDNIPGVPMKTNPGPQIQRRTQPPPILPTSFRTTIPNMINNPPGFGNNMVGPMMMPLESGPLMAPPFGLFPGRFGYV